mmetsp:Transcript_16871/g.26915  ORF Transcript_16871/g.26915 Transcript_16871/m.26915 type:complete len:82 (-) Transcript_16871:94-339(-)
MTQSLGTGGCCMTLMTKMMQMEIRERGVIQGPGIIGWNDIASKKRTLLRWTRKIEQCSNERSDSNTGSMAHTSMLITTFNR